ncbi:MAG TPA: hypothetical protein VF627_12960 [Abditibacterium sp.]|jgi:hypothetical protein
MTTLLKFRVLLSGFIVGVLLSGATAFPLTWELNLLVEWLAPHRERFPALFEWVSRVRTGLVQTDAQFPFIAYGTDWLAFGHLMIAAAYIGPWRDPVRNRFILEWGMFCCVAVIPLAFVCGPIRGIPLGWTLVDCAFGVVGLPVLYVCWKWSKELERGG